VSEELGRKSDKGTRLWKKGGGKVFARFRSRTRPEQKVGRDRVTRLEREGKRKWTRLGGRREWVRGQSVISTYACIEYGRDVDVDGIPSHSKGVVAYIVNRVLDNERRVPYPGNIYGTCIRVFYAMMQIMVFFFGCLGGG
jgi:hypothetical protein